jgi:hypothetical protein
MGYSPDLLSGKVEGMDISGWEIDLPSVYGGFWKKRAQFHLTERLYQSPDSQWAVLLFGIGEMGINKQVGRLALFRDKQAPRLVYHSGETAFWYEGGPSEEVVFNPDSRQAHVFEFLNKPKLDWRERVLDFEAGGLIRE